MRRKCFGTTLAGAALLLAACQKQTAIEPSVQAVTAGVVATIQPDTPERYSATIAPIAQVDLAFKSAGLIEKICQVRGADGRMRNVQAGDKVGRDTELALVTLRIGDGVGKSRGGLGERCGGCRGECPSRTK